MKKVTKKLHEVVQLSINLAFGKIHNTNLPVPYIQSPPGAGKSAQIADYCSRNNIGFLSCHLAFKPLEDLSGLPEFEVIQMNGENVKSTIWTLPELVGLLWKLDTECESSIFLIDDFHLCPPGHADLGYELFTNRTLRGYDIPGSVGIMLAGNDSSKANRKTLSSGIVNRCIIMSVEADFQYWWDNFAIPNELYPPILGFLKQKANRQWFHGEEMVNEPWPSPRSWTFMANVLSGLEIINDRISPEDVVYYATSQVGKDAGIEFASWHELYSKVDTGKAFRGEIEIPDNINEVFIYAHACVIEYFNRQKAEEAMAKIIIAIAKKSAEMSISAVKTLVDFDRNKRSNAYMKIMTHIAKMDNDVRASISDAIMEI